MGTLTLNIDSKAGASGVETPTARLRWWKPKKKDPRGRFILQQLWTVWTVKTDTGMRSEWREIPVEEEK